MLYIVALLVLFIIFILLAKTKRSTLISQCWKMYRCFLGKSESEVAVISLQDRLKWAEQHVVRKVVSFPPLLEILTKIS